MHRVNKYNDKHSNVNQVESIIMSLGLEIKQIHLNKPWGCFFVLEDSSLSRFLNLFFAKRIKTPNANMSLKILYVEPNCKLSWQYHKRRSEYWNVLKGPVGIVQSETDEKNKMVIAYDDEIIFHKAGIRHRIIGLEHPAVLAELWIHEHSDDPSDEDDIVRIQDDYNRDN